MALFEFLAERERAGASVSRTDMAKAMGVKEQTIKDYIGKGYLRRILSPANKGRFSVHGVAGLTPEEFHQAITQSQRIRELGSACKEPLAAALLRKARDNMILGLELYNRTSIENRIDAFAMLFIAAWEQLLKARLVEAHGEDAVFRAHKKGKTRETIGLRECLDRLYPGSSSVRQNIERVQLLRDQATHLLVPEIQGVLSRIFQAGVINFSKAFAEFSGLSLVAKTSTGLISLVADQGEPSVVYLNATYGKTTGAEIQALFQALREDVDRRSDTEFAIPFEYRLTFSKESTAGEIALTKVADAATVGLVVEKPVSATRTHPLISREVVEIVNQQLDAQLSETDRVDRLSTNSERKTAFTTHDFQAVLHKKGWKKADNEFHFHMEKMKRHLYSHAAVEHIVRRMVEDPEYLERARSSYRANQKKARAKRSR